ncbi:mRNA interferase MazF [Paenibacillus turicensis]|uniref:mRNA interferase MazF n=1 Tax=Paenibacillus turicensis TaxID=160487 RepID=A0ABS4FUR0_9BACL|nr:type II toxin-antitoxin system PemK/MazF family toxin [Paenibacillus turicensis]MBP1906318.1 mRNA interferase MazF [Paenibacillus turicensis]
MICSSCKQVVTNVKKRCSCGSIPAKRADVYLAKLNQLVHDEEWTCPIVVIQNNMGNLHSPTLQVIAASNGDSHPLFVKELTGYSGDGAFKLSVDVSRIMTIDKQARLLKPLGKLSKYMMSQLENKLKEIIY